MEIGKRVIEEFIGFLPYMLEARFIMQLAVIAVAAVIVLGPTDFTRRKSVRKKQRKEICIFIVHAVVAFLFLAASDMFLWVVSTTVLRSLKGINFSLAVLCGLCIYGGLQKRYQPKVRWTMVWVLFATCVVMMEWSAPGVVEIVKSATHIPGGAVDALSNILILFFAVFIRKLLLAHYDISWLHMVLTCIEAVMVSMSAMIYEVVFTNNPEIRITSVKMYMVFIFTLMYGVNLLTYTFSYLIAKDRQQLLDMQMLEQKQEAELELMRLSESNLQELREIRHDIKNHCLYMRNMLEEKQYTELNDYFEKFTGKFTEQLFRKMDYGNKMVSAIMNLENGKAAENNIQINANVVIPKKLPFDESDFCSLMMNLIDNALEECVRTDGEKKINVIMTTRGEDYFYFCVTNPTNKSQKEIARKGLETSKEERKLHGYGINIVKKIAEKYDGHFHYYVENGIFIAEVMMNINLGKGEK